jgi:hypothetical protein
MAEDSSVLLRALEGDWMALWPKSISIWSPYVRLRRPVFCITKDDEKKEGLSGSFAMIRLADYSVVVSLRIVHKSGLDGFATEIMAHEIGHHVYCPADLADLGRMIARMRAALSGCEHQAPLVSNLYGDLLINDRLEREHDLRMERVYAATNPKNPNRFWVFYMRTCEILWTLEKGSLAGGAIGEDVESDAVLAARLVRNFGRDWVAGAGSFASICYTYLLANASSMSQSKVWIDAGDAGAGAEIPAGLSEMDDDELSGAVHPALGDKASRKKGSEKAAKGTSGCSGNFREPFAYGQILKSMGISLSDAEIAIRYYRERALPHLIPFITEKRPESKEPQPEGLDTWDPGEPLDDLAWFESVARSPVVIPGYTTVERVFGTTEGGMPSREPVDLDVYIDSSGSMPSPSVSTSYLTLAGTIIALSALRTGSRVQATLWSGAGSFRTTGGFISDEKRIMAIITGYLGGGTAFPIHILRDTYGTREARDRKVHILVISDDGVTTMFNKDERGESGAKIAQEALERARAGGTWALNLWSDPSTIADMQKAVKMGWVIHAVRDWEGLVAFSRSFVTRNYAAGYGGDT